MLRQKFVQTIYATHNQSPEIQKALDRVLQHLDSQVLGLNIGAGPTNLHPRLINLDISSHQNIDCIAQAEYLPFDKDCFTLIITQETLEHVKNPYLAVQEMYRVLKPGGYLYCQLPFTIGYHPGPTDYWRFTKEGIKELVHQAGFTCEEISIAVGPATGFYRILVEFVSLLLCRIHTKLYYPTKGLVALLFYPIKFLDSFLNQSKQADRTAGGYYIIAKKYV